MREGDFRTIETNEELLPCPFCGSEAELVEFKVGPDWFRKLVCCTNHGGFDGHNECQLYLPSTAAYRSTKREAIDCWNTRMEKKESE